MLLPLYRSAVMALTLVACLTVSAQCDPLEVDFGTEPWGLAPDGEETFFDAAEIDVPYTDDVHLLVPSTASEVVPDTPLDAPIDSVVISAVLLVDTIAGDTLYFAEVGMSYECNNLGDCTDPCTFLGGSNTARASLELQRSRVISCSALKSRYGLQFLVFRWPLLLAFQDFLSPSWAKRAMLREWQKRSHALTRTLPMDCLPFRVLKEASRHSVRLMDNKFGLGM